MKYLLSLGLGIYSNSDSSFSIADPLDNEDGFYLTGDSWPPLVDAAIDFYCDCEGCT